MNFTRYIDAIHARAAGEIRFINFRAKGVSPEQTRVIKNNGA